MDFLKDLSIDKVRNIAEDAFNQAKPKTDIEARVYEVLSHKNWGSSSSLMHEVARDTFDADRFHVVARLMWEGMENQRPAAWRVVFKSLTLLEFLIKNGAERCVDDARNHGHVLRAMGQFNYYEGTIDRGLGVREKSKQILEILGDDERIREERQKAKQLRERFGGAGSTSSGGGGGGGGGGNYAGYGNQESWDRGNTGGGNTGGGGGGGGGSSGYGQGGIDSSPYDNGGGGQAYSGRYGNDNGTSASAAPTFASIPDDSRKKKTKKKTKKREQGPPPQAAAPAEPVIDLFSFDAAPAPAPPTAADDFGDFQSTPSANVAPPAANDEFSAFASAKVPVQADPFAAPAPQQQQQQVPTASFDAFGNNGGQAMNPGMATMNNAFGNVNLSQQPQQMQQQQQPQMTTMGAPAPPMAGGGDDDFGDFSSAAPSLPVKARSNDPMANLVSLDGLSKNTNQTAATNNASNNVAFSGMGGMNFNNNANFINNAPQANNMPIAPIVIESGGSDAISNMMGPPPPSMAVGMQKGLQPQQNMQQQRGMPQQGRQQQQQGMQQRGVPQQGMQQNQGMPQGGMQQGMMNPQMMQQMNPQMMNMMGNQQMAQGQMGGMQGNMMGNQQMAQGQMGGMQGNMMGNQQMGGMQGNQMGGQMGGQQQWR